MAKVKRVWIYEATGQELLHVRNVRRTGVPQIYHGAPGEMVYMPYAVEGKPLDDRQNPSAEFERQGKIGIYAPKDIVESLPVREPTPDQVIAACRAKNDSPLPTFTTKKRSSMTACDCS